MGRSDCCKNELIGAKVYAGDILCGIVTKFMTTDKWISLVCPTDGHEGTKANFVNIVQPNKNTLSICGIQVYGHYKDSLIKLEIVDGK